MRVERETAIRAFRPCIERVEAACSRTSGGKTHGACAAAQRGLVRVKDLPLSESLGYERQEG